MDAKVYLILQESMSDVWLADLKNTELHQNEEAYNKAMAEQVGALLAERGIQVIEIDKPEIQVREVPVLVGHTTKRWGENGYHVCEIGTPVYEFEGGYFIESVPLTANAPAKRVRFYKDRFNMLKPLTDG